MPIYAREGDFIEVIGRAFFDVKGYTHPPNRIVAYIRYYPDPKGSRYKENMNYTLIRMNKDIMMKHRSVFGTIILAAVVIAFVGLPSLAVDIGPDLKAWYIRHLSDQP